MKKSRSGVTRGSKVKAKRQAAGQVSSAGDLLNSRLLQLAVAAAIGTSLGRDALAATTSITPDASAAKDFDTEATRAERAEAENNAAAPEAKDKTGADQTEKADGAKELAEVALDPEQIARAEQGEAIVVADASEAIGIQTDQPMRLAAETTQSATPQAGSAKGAASGSATSSGAAAGEAAGAAAGDAAAGSAAADAAGALGAAGAAGISPIAVGAIALGAAAAGGGGGGGAAAAAGGGGGVAAVGFAAKGILSGATVFYDFNGDGKLSAGDASATTAANGSYSISLTAAQATQVATGLNNVGGPLKLIVAGGTDTVANAPFTGVLSAVAPTNVATEAKITLFSTLEASGMAKTSINEMLGVQDYEALDESSFDGAGDGAESIAIKVYTAVQAALTAAGTTADISEALQSGDVTQINAGIMESVMNGVTEFFDSLAAKGDLAEMLDDLATAGQLDNVITTAVNTTLDIVESVLTAAGDIDTLSATGLQDALQQMDAVANSAVMAFLESADDELTTLANELTVGDAILTDPTAGLAAAAADAGTAATAVTTNSAKLALASEYGATLRLDSGAAYAFQGFQLDEAAASALADRIASGDVAADPFGADAVYLQVEGTLLGTADNPLTYGQLQALGVTVIQEDAYAPYLRLTNENVADGSELDGLVGLITTANSGGIAGADGLVYYAEGTALDYSGDISGGVNTSPTTNDADTDHTDATLDDLLTYYNFDIGT